jgi:N-acetylmuramoyl-L-alanine amidase
MNTSPLLLSRRTLLRIGATLSASAALLFLVYTQVRRKYTMDMLTIVPRAAWGALAPDSHASNEPGLFDPHRNPDGWQVYATPLNQVLTTVVVHHSALPLRDGPAEIQRVHMRVLGFADIGYHFVIDAKGQLYEGRSLAVRGAHTRGHNTGTVGVVLLGHFEQSEPSTAQLATLSLLLECLRDSYQISHVAGHRDFLPSETVCPGQRLEVLLPDLAARVGLRWGTDGYRKPNYAS